MAVPPTDRLKKKHENVRHIHTQKYLQISNAINYKDTF